MKKKLFVTIVFIFTASSAFAAGVQTIDQLLSNYYSNTSGWLTTLYPVAKKLYWFLFTLEFFYQITIKKVLANDIQKLWYFIIVRVFVGYVFEATFVNTSFYIGVIKDFSGWAAAAGGIPIDLSSGSPLGGYSPSIILGFGTTMWTAGTNLVTYMPDVITAVVTGLPVMLLSIGVYVLVGIIAVSIFMTILEAWVVLNAGIILLGFAGSSWTMGFWNKYLSYVGGVAIRLFVMSLILGIVYTQLFNDSTALATASSDYMKAYAAGTQSSSMVSGVTGLIIKLFIDILIGTFLIVKVPSMAGSMLSGSVNAGLGDAIAGASMMLAGAGIAAGLAKMGLNMGGGGGGSSGGAKEAFKDSLRGAGGGSTGGGSGGGSSGGSGTSRTATQTAKSAESSQKKAEALSSKNPDSNSKNFAEKMQSQSNGASSSGSGASGSGLDGSNSGGGNGSRSPSSQTSGSSGGASSDASNQSTTQSGANSSVANTNSSSPNASSSSNQSRDVGSADNNSGGGISGNNPNTTTLPSKGVSAGAQNNKSTANDKKRNDAKRSFNQNSSDLKRNFEKMIKDQHSGGAEVNINPHKE